MKTKTKKPRASKPQVIDVRFVNSPCEIIYTYKVPRRYKPRLGDELVADTPLGTAVVIVVRLKDPDAWDGPLKTITRKVVNI
jgi:hypothetical protein